MPAARRPRGRQKRTRSQVLAMRLLTPGLIASLCHCCPNTVAGWLRGKLLPFRWGIDPFNGSRARLVVMEDLRAFLKVHDMPDPWERLANRTTAG